MEDKGVRTRPRSVSDPEIVLEISERFELTQIISLAISSMAMFHHHHHVVTTSNRSWDRQKTF